jgi:hypothetical protein
MVRPPNSSRIKMFLSSPGSPVRLWTPESPVSNEYGCCFLELKRPWHDVEHSPLSSTEAKNEWIYTFTSPVRLHGVDKENFTFYQAEMSGEFHFSVGLQLTADKPLIRTQQDSLQLLESSSEDTCMMAVISCFEQEIILLSYARQRS